MRTADLTGAQLDYWVARAEDYAAKDLSIVDGQCVRQYPDPARRGGFARTLNFSAQWALCGPLIIKYRFHAITEQDTNRWSARCEVLAEGPDIMTAICRAVVRAAFGDQVEELP